MILQNNLVVIVISDAAIDWPRYIGMRDGIECT